MRQSDFDKYLSDKFSLEMAVRDPGDSNIIFAGKLIDLTGIRPPVLIENGIPRFVSGRNYADNFGLQWNTFRSNQLDSRNGLRLSFNRFWSATRWKPRELFGRTVLEIGSGAGRFTEVLLDAGAIVVSVDFSSAVDANAQNNSHRGNLFLLQADLYELPLADNLFDFVFCHGVLQHTPDPDLAWKCMFEKLVPGGKLSIDFYRKYNFPNVWSTPKYIWRPFTSKMDPKRLLRIIQFYIPIWFPVDNIIRRIPKIGPVILSMIPIPCWNPVGSGLDYDRRREWAIMDTFDALGATFDEPRTLEQVRRMVELTANETVEVFFGGNGIVANVSKRRES